MARLNRQWLINGVVGIAVILLLSQAMLWRFLPEAHTNLVRHHPMEVIESRRSLQRRQQIEQQKSIYQQLQEQPPKRKQLQQKQRPKSSHEKNQVNHKQKEQRNPHIISMHKKRRAVPTAKTVAPFLNHTLFKGKERLLTMLFEAHYFNDSAIEFFQNERKVQQLAEKLPLWETITSRLNTREPQIFGLATCKAYRKQVPPSERLVGVAGMFATGTNLLADLLVGNCKNEARAATQGGGSGVRWQVNWGKHSPARYRLVNFIDPRLNNTNYLPVVTTRHPYSWLQSMCRQRYSTHWFHNAEAHCPNLVPNDIDRWWYNFTVKFGKQGVKDLYPDPWLNDNMLDTANFTLDAKVVPVRVRFKSGTLFYKSLAHFWNEWLHEYFDADYPRLVVRLEDIVFFPKETISQICDCIGGKTNEDFLYQTETAKVGGDNIHGKDRTDMFKWLSQWHSEDQTKNMTTEDLEYLRNHLDPLLLKTFHYRHPPMAGDAVN